MSESGGVFTAYHFNKMKASGSPRKIQKTMGFKTKRTRKKRKSKPKPKVKVSGYY
jgi:hypothetical protein